MYHTAGDLLPGIAGGLTAKIVRASVDHDGSSKNFTDAEPVCQHSHISPAAAGQQRRQIPRVLRVGSAFGIIVSPCQGRAHAGTGGALMDMETVDPRSVPGQAEDPGLHKHAPGLLIKPDCSGEPHGIPRAPETGNRPGTMILLTQYAHLIVSICRRFPQGSFRRVQLLSVTEPSIYTACSEIRENPQALWIARDG